MKKYLILFVCLLIIFLLVGCEQNTELDVDPREKEVVQLVVREKYEEAISKAKELYEGEELDEMLDWINSYAKRNKEHEKWVKEQFEDMYPSTKLEIQSGYTYKIKGNYVYITGRVKNVSDSDISYFEIRVDFLDNEGNVLDSDYTNDGLTLKPGEMREFEIMHRWSDDYKKYSLSIGNVK